VSALQQQAWKKTGIKRPTSAAKLCSREQTLLSSTAASLHPCGELQHFAHPKTGVLVYAEPLSHFRALFVFVQHIS